MQVFASKKRQQKIAESKLINNAFDNPQDIQISQIIPKVEDRDKSMFLQKQHYGNIQYSQKLLLEMPNVKQMSIAELYQPIPQLMGSDSQRRINVTKNRKITTQQTPNKKESVSIKKIHHLGGSNIKKQKEEASNIPIDKILALSDKKQLRDIQREQKTVLSAMREQPIKSGIHLLFSNECESKA